METIGPQTAGKTSSAGTSLDWDLETLRHHLEEASELVIRLYRSLDHARITPAKSCLEIASLFDELLPEEPQPIDTIFHEVESNILANSALNLSPRFFGYINGSGNHVAILGELLASAINQICAKWHFSPAASEVERRVIRWIAEFIGYSPDAGGCLLSGGSAGNLVALAIARNEKVPFEAALRGMSGGPPLTVYVSEEGHASVEKSMVLLGMGDKQLRKIAVTDDFKIDLVALKRQIAEDRGNRYHPVCVVGNAGTTNTGAVDPLDALAKLCQEQELWFHVDAAYGGPAGSTKVAGTLFRGLDRADSVVINPHKWLYLPVEVACILVRKTQALRDSFRIVADYLQEKTGDDELVDSSVDLKDYSPQLSRSFRALKVWMTFKAYGAHKIRAAIESNIEIMQYLANRIDGSHDFIRLAPVSLSVVCFQYRTANTALHADSKYLDKLNDRVLEELERDGRVFLSGTKVRGRRVLRACSVNHRLRRQDVDFLLDVIRELGSRVARTL